jgi:hypothetical protein
MALMRTLLLVAVTLVSQGALAQVVRDRAERTQDKRELRQDHREQRDDRRDRNKLLALLVRYDAARAKNDYQALTAMDTELRDLVGAEIRESRREWLRDSAEVARDRGEVGSDRRELGRDRARGAGPGVRADDRRDRRDDKADLRDDVRDRRAEGRNLVRLDGIEKELGGLWGRVDNPSLEQKRNLVAELLAMSTGELAGDRAEKREDHRELREDRRETREDVRQK